MHNKKPVIVLICIILIFTTFITGLAESQVKITSNTKVYESKSTHSKSIKVKKNTTAILTEYSNSWGKIRNPKNNMVRYIQMKYLKAIDGIPTWSKESTKIFKSKSTKSKKITSLQKGEQVKLWKTDGKWAYVETNKHKKGYIQQSKLSQAKIQTETPEIQAPPEPQDTSKINRLINNAKNLLGKPYQKNAKGPNAFDCSNFVAYCYKTIGISISGDLQTLAYTTKNMTKITNLNECKPGDILLFNSNEANQKEIDHASIYIGNNQIIHASESAKKVLISSITSFYKRTFKWALRPNNT